MIPGSMYKLAHDQTFYVDINDMSSHQRLRARCGEMVLVLATYPGLQNSRTSDCAIDELGWVQLVTYLIRNQMIIDVKMTCLIPVCS